VGYNGKNSVFGGIQLSKPFFISASFSSASFRAVMSNKINNASLLPGSYCRKAEKIAAWKKSTAGREFTGKFYLSKRMLPKNVF
jgi:hypothetical protein